MGNLFIVYKALLRFDSPDYAKMVERNANPNTRASRPEHFLASDLAFDQC